MTRQAGSAPRQAGLPSKASFSLKSAGRLPSQMPMRALKLRLLEGLALDFALHGDDGAGARNPVDHELIARLQLFVV